MVDLINELSELDKQRLCNYIYKYGVNKDNFMGLDKWLQNWNHSNQTLYKLLGNQLTYEVDYKYNKSREEKREEIDHLMCASSFPTRYRDFLWEISHDYPEVDFDPLYFCRTYIFLEDKIEYPFKVKLPGYAKTLQLQAGMKPMRALQKISMYFAGTKYEKYFKHLEDFRIKMSMITNGVQAKAQKFVISIHPLDYITMSDNSLGWSSCMTWGYDDGDRGCYSVGTVEMMNSNNVLCCYIKSDEPFYFDKKNKDEAHEWNNKKWRCLGYYNKDIIMSGKSYPYQADQHKKFLIEVIKDLAEKNLGRTYSFGPELYKDMIHITNWNRMDKHRYWRNIGDTFKHNILWDTKGMYNDMLNDNECHYWCYRNKVEKRKIISVSGKAPCLCCGNQVPVEDSCSEYYNDRYADTGNVVCYDCYNTKFHRCVECGDKPVTKKIIEVTFKSTGSKRYYCEDCFEEYFKLCPECGKPFYINDRYLHLRDFMPESSSCAVGFYQPERFGDKYTRYEEHGEKTETVCVCPDCKKNGSYKKIFKEGTLTWEGDWFTPETHAETVPLLLPEYDEYRSSKLKNAPSDITEI